MNDPTRSLSEAAAPSTAPGGESFGTASRDDPFSTAPGDPAAGGSATPTAPPGYDLLEQVGQGGMGVVYRARDRSIGRDVAVKLLQDKFPADSLTARRFLDEAKITGQLQHPGIPAVHQIGTLPNGRPFLAMKLIRGKGLDALLKEQGPGSARWLGVFEGVCQAVGYAHAHGVIHRDLKPANVMVGAFGEVQVMDWGLAKILASRDGTRSASDGVSRDRDRPGADLDADSTVTGDPAPAPPPEIRVSHPGHTQDGAILGTLAFMPPEQAVGAIDRIDRRTDVFGLGGILCALLTGQPPYVGSTAESTRQLAADAKLDDAFTRLAACGAEPDLIALAKRCLSAEPADRPADASEVAAAVAAFRGELEARAKQAEVERGKAEVQAAEQGKRRRVQTWATVIAGSILAAGVVGTSLGMVQAESRRVEADQARGREKDRADGERAARIELWDGLDAMTSDVTEESLSTQKQVSAEQKRFLSNVLPQYQKLMATTGEDEGLRARTARAAYRVGLIEAGLGHKGEAVAAFRMASDGYEKLAADFPASPEYRSEFGRSLNTLGSQLATLTPAGAAEEPYRRALEVFQKLAAEFADRPEHRRDLAGCRNNLGKLLSDLGRHDEAADEYREGLVLQRQVVEELPNSAEARRALALSHIGLGTHLKTVGRWVDAEGQFRQALDVNRGLVRQHPGTAVYRDTLANTRGQLADVLRERGRSAEAIAEYREALGLYLALAAEYPTVPEYRRFAAATHHGLGLVLFHSGEWKGAEEELRNGLAITRKLAEQYANIPDYRDSLAKGHGQLGNFLQDTGNLPDAAEQYKAGLDLTRTLVRDSPDTPEYRRTLVVLHTMYGNLLVKTRKWAAAEGQFRSGLEAARKLADEFHTVPEYRVDLGTSHVALADFLVEVRKWPEAEKHYRAGLAVNRKLVDEFAGVIEYRRKLANNHGSLGLLLENWGKVDAAYAECRAGMAINRQLAKDAPDDPENWVQLGGSYCNLGNLVREGDQPKDRLAWYEKAVEALAPTYKAEPRNVKARVFLRNSHAGRAQMCDALGRFGDAVTDWDRAVGLSPSEEQPVYRAARAHSKLRAGLVTEAVAEVAEVSKVPGCPPDFLYNFACVYAVASGKIADKKQEYAAAAVELLIKAVKAGFKDAAHVKTDADLDPLRDRDDFKKVVAELEAKFPPKREVLPAPRKE